MATRLLVLIFSLSFFTLSAHAQQVGYINGRIVNEKGKSMDGVTVAVTGTSIGTNTDRKGNYKLEVPANVSITVIYSSHSIYISGCTLKISQIA